MEPSLSPEKLQALAKYLDLLRTFTRGSLSAHLFEQEYLVAFKNEKILFGGTIYYILNELFGDVDEYCSDPAIRDEDDIDDEELLKRARVALERLEAICSGG